MSIQGQFNQALGAVAATATIIDKSKEAEASKQVALKKEDKELSVKEAENELAITKAQHDVDEAQKAYDKVAPDAKGRYRDNGKFMSKEAGEKRAAPSRYDLEVMQKALDIRKKEQEALAFQRAQWKLNVGGTK